MGLEAVQRVVNGELRLDEPMSRHTTLRIGGPADAWVAPRTIDELERILAACAGEGVPVAAVGGGSNLLVLDGGVRGLVVSTRLLRRLERLGPTGVIVEAGVSTGKALHAATEWELGGVEFLGGVPGSVGGGLVMNAGTYLGEFKDVTVEVASVRIADGALVRRDNAACGFRYRGSDLPRDEVVVEATLRLRPRPRGEIEAEVRTLRDRRHEREPKGLPNAGSIFKNPPGDYAGRLIEACGLKGRRVGGAEVSPKHANWIVNVGAARAADVLELIDIVRESVKERHGIDLELEVKVLGDPPA
ncbi:MAG TPA: UDP-N-acetylmuramate dehydrogenase [Haliangiales bacterium]|nr:UDP-N-acetylmuramate dehydrogenase [Haliangiales bacterium]